MTEADGAWMARILARFDDPLVAAAVGVGKYDPLATEYLTRTLISRRQKLLKRYLTRLSPLANIHVDNSKNGARLCGFDVARHAGIVPPTAAPAARIFRGRDLDQTSTPAVELTADGMLCVPLAHTLPNFATGQALDDRYLVVEIVNGQAEGPLRAHLYDLGPDARLSPGRRRAPSLDQRGPADLVTLSATST